MTPEYGHKFLSPVPVIHSTNINIYIISAKKKKE
jgi:hypothetical protein